MKRIVALIMVSLTMILIVVAVGYKTADKTQFVKAVRIDEKTAVERLNYSGAVEYSGSAYVTAKGSGIVQSVFYKNGDKVNQGDVILAVCETYADISGSDVLSALTSSDNVNISDLSRLFEGDGSSVVTAYTAPKSGIVSGLDAQSGGVYMKGQTLFKTSSESSFQVQLNVSEKDISKIKQGQPVNVKCKAISRSLSGEVKAVGDYASQGSAQSGKAASVKVTVTINSDGEPLRSGYTADCSIITETRQNTLLVPYSAVVSSQSGGSSVFKEQDGVLIKQRVTLGKEYSNGVEVVGGIKHGDIVALNASEIMDEKHTVVNEVLVN